MNGQVNSFETFGTVDGPGIRFVVFFQGCPLQCKYCHNRDTWDPQKGDTYTVEEIMDKMDKYEEFYRSSGGGITASGGEPTLQAEFVTLLFEKVKEKEINTALDTSGFVAIDKVSPLIDVTDLVLLDLKVIDPDKHFDLTGVRNDLILEFAEYLSRIEKPVWIRHVLIPGITTGEEDITAMAKFINSLKNIKKVELLPYHDYGKAKWAALDCPYPLEGTPMPTSAEITEIINKYQQKGVVVAPVGEKMD